MTRKLIHHSSPLGKYYVGKSEDLLRGRVGKRLKGKVQLILTSPPFILNQEKKYGNLAGEEYKEWFIGFAALFSSLLKEDGSIVIELGNAWQPRRPIQSTLPLESLLGFLNHPEAKLHLCQQFICYNPARLPSPAQWVTVERIRVNDSYTNIWWMAKSDTPKADNRKILRPYSKSMRALLRKQSYNPGSRPSEHQVSASGFLEDQGGSIHPNLFELEPIEEGTDPRLPNVMRFANTRSNDYFSRECRKRGIAPHPARMQPELAAFFIEFLTDEGDLVLDPFAGSNTTGYVAELLGRRWVSIDLEASYAVQSKIRLSDPLLKEGNHKR